MRNLRKSIPEKQLIISKGTEAAYKFLMSVYDLETDSMTNIVQKEISEIHKLLSLGLYKAAFYIHQHLPDWIRENTVMPEREE